MVKNISIQYMGIPEYFSPNNIGINNSEKEKIVSAKNFVNGLYETEEERHLRIRRELLESKEIIEKNN